MICVVLINLLQKYKKVIAIDADSNKNLIDYIFNDKIEEKSELWELREEIFKKSEVSKSSYERKYFPKNWIWVFELNQNDKIFQKTAYQKENISLIQLWEPKEKRVWVTWMCPYNETMKVFLSISHNLIHPYSKDTSAQVFQFLYSDSLRSTKTE